MSPVTNHQSPITNHQEEINFLDYWLIIKKYRKMIIACVALASVLSAAYSLTLTKMYRTEATIIPISSKGSGGLSSITSQLGGMASLVGASLGGMGPDDASKLLVVFNSRTLAENVIEKGNLMPILFSAAWDQEKNEWKSEGPQAQPTMASAVRTLKGAVKASDDKKTKSIKITGEFSDPIIAARLVNLYIDELQKFINNNSLTTAKRNRLFIEKQLEDNKFELLESGKEFNEFYKIKNISSSESKVDVDIKAKKGFASGLKTGDSFIEALLMDNTNKKENGFLLETADIEGLLAQKSDVEKKISETRLVENVPQQVYLTYIMIRRELLAKVNALLTTQYELAKIEESKEDLAFQVIDKAVPPEQRFKPKRAQMVMTSFIASLLFAVLLAFFLDYLKKMKGLPAKK